MSDPLLTNTQYVTSFNQPCGFNLWGTHNQLKVVPIEPGKVYKRWILNQHDFGQGYGLKEDNVVLFPYAGRESDFGVGGIVGVVELPPISPEWYRVPPPSPPTQDTT